MKLSIYYIFNSQKIINSRWWGSQIEINQHNYEVRLKEKPVDTSKILHQNKTRSTGSAGKGIDPNFAIIGTGVSGKCRCVTPEGT